VEAVLTGWCSPVAEKHLRAAEIDVISNLSGTAIDAVNDYVKTYSAKAGFLSSSRLTLLNIAFINTVKQFVNILPVLVGVVLLIGLINSTLSKETLSSIFTGNAIVDTLIGAGFGSLFAGNPVNSYVISDDLLTFDVSLYAVTAFILSWVSVGLVQMPAEGIALGKRYALWRNGLALVMVIPVALLTVLLKNAV
jgi:uncharacterized membrane protein YraQ (UPF0718 family)